MKLEEIIRISEIALLVKAKIRKIRARELTFVKHADLHFIAAMYMIDKKRMSDSEKFIKVKRVITRVFKELKKKYGEDITPNKMFSKMDETWNLINKYLK